MGTDQQNGRFRVREILDGVATLAIIALCGTVTWAIVARGAVAATKPNPTPRAAANRPPAPPLPSEPISLQGAIQDGAASAKVAVIQYSEFKCPYCGVFARDTLPTLKKKYLDTGKVVIAFRHFPLDTLHPFARQAAQAAECANQQGQFWAFHDRMFAQQKELDAVKIAAYAKEISLDSRRFSSCMEAEAARVVDADVESGKALGVTGTPTFFIGIIQADGRVKLRERLTGAQPITQFELTIDKVIAEVQGKQ